MHREQLQRKISEWTWAQKILIEVNIKLGKNIMWKVKITTVISNADVLDKGILAFLEM
jgi:hypothetical protein